MKMAAIYITTPIKKPMISNKFIMLRVKTGIAAPIAAGANLYFAHTSGSNYPFLANLLLLI